MIWFELGSYLLEQKEVRVTFLLMYMNNLGTKIPNFVPSYTEKKSLRFLHILESD